MEVDDGLGGNFNVVFGEITDTLTLAIVYNNVTRGLEYRARYRARNVVGWSAYSPIGFLLAAQVPAKPQQPEFISATDSTISILVNKATDNGGSMITSHELWIDDGQGVFV